MSFTPQDFRSISGQMAVVGIGDTDYRRDYQIFKTEKRPSTDATGYGARAFKAALKDSGLERKDIDGLIVGMGYPYDRAGELLGLNPRWSSPVVDSGSALFLAAGAISSGRAECIAIVMGLNFLSAGAAFGGPQAMGAEMIPHYAYYQPWGFTSQGAFDGVVVQRYMEIHGLTHRELGQVAVAQRAWASMNPQAIMQTPMTIEDYLAAPYIVAPMRRPDYCVICDGGVAMIVTTTERAKRIGQNPVVTIEGLGAGEDNRDNSQLRAKLKMSRVPLQAAAEEAFNMAALGPKDMDAFYNYDNFSGELFYTLEACGYCADGEASKFIKEQGIGPGGKLPINTSGGMLSEAYMIGWNAQVEAVRQLRGREGRRQVPDCRNVQYMWNTLGHSNSVIYGRR